MREREREGDGVMDDLCILLQGDLKIIPDTHVATWNRWLENSR